jgi:hypothetical protein
MDTSAWFRRRQSSIKSNTSGDGEWNNCFSLTSINDRPNEAACHCKTKPTSKDTTTINPSKHCLGISWTTTEKKLLETVWYM